MKTKKKSVEPIPDEFNSYDEAAKFWDTHDTTDYLDVSRPVTVVSEFRGRYAVSFRAVRGISRAAGGIVGSARDSSHCSE